MMATDISAPEKEAVLGGRMMRLRFDHNQMRQSEMYYQATTGRRLGYIGIVAQAVSRTYVGLGAIAYGAAAAAQQADGQQTMVMREFDNTVTYDELRAAGAALMAGVTESLPKPAKKADGPAQQTT